MSFITVALCPWRKSCRYPITVEDWVGLGAENLMSRQWGARSLVTMLTELSQLLTVTCSYLDCALKSLRARMLPFEVE
jgi:hypothetical protein